MLQMLRQTFGLMFGHFLMALRVSVGPMVLGAVAIFALVTLLGLQDLIAVSNEGASPAEADPGAVLLVSLATMLVMLVVGSWIANDKRIDTDIQSLEAQAGDVIDFVVDSRESTTADSFRWSATITIIESASQVESTWRTEKGFHGPLPPPLSGWEQLAHSLLMSNEFVFVD